MMFSESQFDSGSPATAAASRDTVGLVPLTIKQISEASHSGDDKSNFVLSGAHVVNVTIVGMVSNIVERNIDVTFTVDDGTGKLACKKWVNEPVDKLLMEEVRSRGEYMTFFAVYGAASVAGTQMIASFVSNEDDFKQNHQYVILAVGGMVAVICFLTFYLILVYFTALNDPTPCKLIKIALNVFSCFRILAPGVSFIHWAVPVGAIAQPDMKLSPHLTPQKSQIIPSA